MYFFRVFVMLILWSGCTYIALLKKMVWILEQVFSVAEFVNKKFAMVTSVWGDTWVIEITVGDDFRGLCGQKSL